MTKRTFFILNLALLLSAIVLGALGVIETGLGAGCYLYGDKTVFCFAPSVAILFLATLLGGTSIFMLWRRRFAPPSGDLEQRALRGRRVKFDRAPAKAADAAPDESDKP